MRLGLDLQGGMYLLLKVRTDEVLDKELEGLVNDIKARLSSDNVPYQSVRKVENTIQIKFLRSEERTNANTPLSAYLGRSFTISSFSRDRAYYLTVRAEPSYVSKIEEDAFSQVMETLRNRIDQLGVAEPNIQRQGLTGHRILIQLPGLKDPDQAKRVIGKVAELEFRIVIEEAPTKETLMAKFPAGCPDSDPADQKEKYVCPDGSVILPGALPALGDRSSPGYYRLEGNVPASGRDLESAHVGADQYGKPDIEFTIKPASSTAFGRLTKENLGKQMAIILDGRVKSAPTLQGRITRNGQITGYFTQQEAYELALTLRSGALPASVEYLEERSVGATLGDDSIRQGRNALLFGFFLVLIFIVIYYRASGINALIGLFFTMLILMAVLALFGAALTLPGIAGLVLTVGMAVDANVLIFERIREEMANTKSVRVAIRYGFDKATSAIADANVTTLIAAFVLMQFGSGPVRGFAITLTIGVLASMFSALVISKLIYRVVLTYWPKFQIRFRALVGQTSYNFLSFRRQALGASLVFIVLGLVSMGFNRVTEGNILNWGIDFSGGALLQVQFAKPVAIDEIRKVLRKTGFTPSIQTFGEENEILIRTQASEASVAKTKMELEAKIKEGLNLPFEFDDRASHAEILLLPEENTKVEDLENALAAVGLGENAKISIQEEKVQIRISEITARILRILKQHYESEEGDRNEVTERRAELVGPQVGDELKEAATLAVIAALIGILLYVSVRFEFCYALGAVVALFHDVLITLAVFSWLGLEVDLPTIAAILTVVGYSLNDTIVVFDRVRENERRFRKKGVIELLNASINETLSRTVLTSLTTLFVVLMLLMFGGEVIKDFAVALTIGVVAGTYSSIFIASPVVYYWGEWQKGRKQTVRSKRKRR